MPTSRSAFLSDLMTTLAADPAYTAALGADTDITIASNPVHASWGAGDERMEYAAALRALESDKTVYFWEVLKPRSSGGLASEVHVGEAKGPEADATDPGAASSQWGYGTLRRMVAEVAVRHGFTVKAVLNRSAASW